jgi:protein SCO1/2
MGSWSSTAGGFSFAALTFGLAFGLAGCAARASLPSYASVPEFSLTDQTGAKFDSGSSLNGHVWVADFMFTECPGPCPRMSKQMSEVQEALKGTDARMVSLTVDPQHDTPPVLAQYAAFYSARPGVWFFLTGDTRTLDHLDRDVFQLGDVDGSLEHSTRFVLVDRSSRVRGFYLTSDADAIPHVIADAKVLLKEKPLLKEKS